MLDLEGITEWLVRTAILGSDADLPRQRRQDSSSPVLAFLDTPAKGRYSFRLCT